MIPLASALRQTAPPISLRASPRTSLTTSTTLPQPPPAGADRAPDAPLPVSGCGHGPAVAAFPVVLVAHPQKLVASAPGGRQGRSPARAGGPQEQGQSALPGNLPAGFHPARPEALRGLLLCAGRCGKQSKGAQAPPLLPALLNQPVQCQRASLPVLSQSKAAYVAARTALEHFPGNPASPLSQFLPHMHRRDPRRSLQSHASNMVTRWRTWCDRKTYGRRRLANLLAYHVWPVHEREQGLNAGPSDRTPDPPQRLPTAPKPRRRSS